MALLAVLFDVGGPLSTEATHEHLVDEHLRAAFATEGLRVGDSAYARACRFAVDSFAPDAPKAIVWHLVDPDVAAARRVFARFRAALTAAPGYNRFELRPGIPDLLRRLYERELRLGLVANQPVSVLAQLDVHGIGGYFVHRGVSGTHGFAKPDPRAFLRACEDLGVRPENCVMVGDRLDNDVAPAKLLGMRAILFRTGRHASQRPRSWEELPDAEVYDAVGLEASLEVLLAHG